VSGETSAAGAPWRSLSTIAKPGEPVERDPLDRGQRRGLGREPHEQVVDRGGIPLGLEQHAALVVQHPSVEGELPRQPVHERPEADALHRAFDARPHPPALAHQS